MRALFFGFLFLLIALVAAVLIGPSFFDWNGQKARIAEEISNITGRPLQIIGDVSLALLPTPRLSAKDVSLANIEGASDPQMAVVEELEVQIDFWPLLRGRVQIESFSLVRPEIYLEVLPDGRRNWDFAPKLELEASRQSEAQQGDAAGVVDESDRRLANQIKLEDFRILDGRLVYRDPEGSQIIESFNAEIAAASLLGPFSLVGSGNWQGNNIRVVANLGRMIKEGAATFNLDIAFPKQKATVRFNGGILSDREGFGLRGQFRTDGDNLTELLQALNPGIGPMPAILGRSFAITTEVRIDRDEIQAADLSARLDALQVEGSLRVLLKAGPSIDLDLTATRLDIDSLLTGGASGGVGTGDGEGAALPAPEETSGNAPAGPDGAATGVLEDDPALLSLLTSKMSLPRHVTGRFKLLADGLVYRGRLVRQLGLEASLAGGRLTIERAEALLPGGSELAFTGELTTPKKVPKFTGRIETASNNFRSLLDWLGLDIASVPANRLRKMSFVSDITLASGQLTATQFDLQLDVTRAKGGLAVALRQRLGFGLGMTVDSLNLDAYLSQSSGKAGKKPPEETTSDPALGEEDGEGDGSAPQLVDKEVSAPGSAPRLDLGALLESFDANLEISIGSLTINRAQAKGIHLDGTLRQGEATIREASVDDFLGASGAYRGELRNLRNQATLDGRFDFEVPNPNRVWKSISGLQHDFGETGTVVAAGSIRGTLENPHIDGSLSAYGGRISVVGELQTAPLAFDMAFDGEHPSVPDLLAAMGQKVDLNPALGAVILTGQMVGGPSFLQLESLAGQIGATEFAGELSLDTSRARAYVEAVLDVGPLAWPAIFQSRKLEQGVLKGSGQARERGWSREPFELSGLQDFDGKLTLSSEALALIGFWLEEVDVAATLEEGVVEVAQLAGKLYGGSFALTGRFSGVGNLESDFSLTATSLDARRVLREWLEVDAISGEIDIEGDFSAKGKNQASLIAALSGEGAIRGTLAFALPGAKVELEPLAPEAKRVKGIADGVSAVQEAFSGAPIDLEGRFTLKRGSLRTQDLRLTGQGASVLTMGRVDLPTWEINSRTDFYRESAPEKAYLSAKLKGSLDAPDVTISGEALRSRAPNNSKTTSPSNETSGEPEEAQFQ